TRRQRIINVHDEKLRSIRVWPSIRHRHRARFVTSLVYLRFRIDLVVEASAPRRLAATPGAGRIPTLDHEALDHTMKNNPVVITTLRERDEILCRLGRVR